MAVLFDDPLCGVIKASFAGCLDFDRDRHLHPQLGRELLDDLIHQGGELIFLERIQVRRAVELGRQDFPGFWQPEPECCLQKYRLQ